MCGKFTQMAAWAGVVEYSRMIPEPATAVVTATPMRSVAVIRLNAAGERETVPMRWGFVDHRTGAPDIPRHMHARCETVDRLPTFADAFAGRRGIVLVHSFNEGEEVDVVYDDGQPAGRKWTRQWTFTPRDGPLAFAVIWELVDLAGQRIDTFVLITTPAHAMVGKVTDRMPAILRPEDWEVWLGETRAPLSEIRGLLRPWEDTAGWSMAPQNPSAKPPRPRKPAARQGDLF
jgi:putative SOS response-associated peptidase YedK